MTVLDLFHRLLADMQADPRVCDLPAHALVTVPNGTFHSPITGGRVVETTGSKTRRYYIVRGKRDD